MRLKVVGRTGVVAGHKLRLPGEVFEVHDAMGEGLSAQYGPALERLGVSPEPVEDAAGGDRTLDVARPLSVPVATLDLSQRVLDALGASDIETVTQLRLAFARGDEAMLAIPGIGRRALAEIEAALTDLSPASSLP